MKTKLITCLVVAATMGLQAQNMKPQKKVEYHWSNATQQWVEDFTHNMRYDQAGNLFTKHVYDHLAASASHQDSFVYNAQGKAVHSFFSKWNQSKNRFVFESRTDNCYDNQWRDCGKSNFKWNGNSWSFTGGYQQTYSSNAANNSTTKMLRVWSNNTQQFEPQESTVTFYNPNGSKASVLEFKRDSASGFLLHYLKQVYEGWHNEGDGIFTALELFERNGGVWVASQKTIIEDSSTYWKYTLLDTAQNIKSIIRSAKDKSAIERFKVVNGQTLLHYAFHKNGPSTSETWLYYDANNVLLNQSKLEILRNQQGDDVKKTVSTWGAVTGWITVSENIYHNTYDSFGNISEIITTTLDIASGIHQNECRVVYSDYIQSGSPSSPCDLLPTITGNLMVCPNDVSVLGTQQFDRYEWYTRPFGSNGQPTHEVADTNQTFSVSHSTGPVYVSVKVYNDTCSETSPEVLVDGYAFLPLTVSSLGNFAVSPDGEQMICPGEAITMVLNLPYVQNITWFNGNDIISNAFNQDTLIVSEPGEYWVVASPAACPNWADALGTPIRVLIAGPENCTTDIDDIPTMEASIFPNPADYLVTVRVPHAGTTQIILYDIAGRVVLNKTFEFSTQINVSGLESGMYLVDILNTKGMKRTKLQLN